MHGQDLNAKLGTPQQVMDKFNQKSLEDVFISVARGGDVLAGEAK